MDKVGSVINKIKEITSLIVSANYILDFPLLTAVSAKKKELEDLTAALDEPEFGIVKRKVRGGLQRRVLNCCSKRKEK